MPKPRNPKLRAALLKANQEVESTGGISLSEAGRLARVLNPDATEFLVRDIVAFRATRIFHAPVTWPGEAADPWVKLPDSTPEYTATLTGSLLRYLESGTAFGQFAIDAGLREKVEKIEKRSAGNRDAGPAGAAARGTLRPLPTAIRRIRVARPGASARASTIQPWAASSSGSTYAKSTAAKRRPAEVRCVAATPTNPLRTSFAPMTDAAGSVAAAGRPPSHEPIAMSAERASRAGGRKRLPEAGRRMASRREAPPLPTDSTTEQNADSCALDGDSWNT